MEKQKPKPLSEILEEQFIGPVLLQAVPYLGAHGASKSVRFILTGNDRDRQYLLDNGVSEYSWLFGVAAFDAEVYKEYSCLVRQRERASIAEVVPVAYQHLTGKEWHDKPVATTFEVIFTKSDSSRWSARHPDTGQFILPHEDLEIPAGGKFAPGTLDLRPTCTRTFWVAGKPGTLKKMTNSALDIFDVENAKPDDFSYAEQFQIMGSWYTAIEAMGNPFAGLFETDDFTLKDIEETAKKLGTEFERWTSKNLLPVIHPDTIANKFGSSKTRSKVAEIAEETLHNILALSSWYERWVTAMVSEIRQRRAVGIHKLPQIPQPVDTKGNRRRQPLLMSLSRERLEQILQPQPKRRTVKATFPTKVKTEVKEKEKKSRSPRPKRTTKVVEHIEIEKGHIRSSGEELDNSIAANAHGGEKLAKLKSELENGTLPEISDEKKPARASRKAKTA